MTEVDDKNKRVYSAHKARRILEEAFAIDSILVGTNWVRMGASPRVDRQSPEGQRIVQKSEMLILSKVTIRRRMKNP